MAIGLHYHPRSTFSRRVLIALAEKQIPHELVTPQPSPTRRPFPHSVSLHAGCLHQQIL